MNYIKFYSVEFYSDYTDVVNFKTDQDRTAFFEARNLPNLTTENIQVVKPPYDYIKVEGNYNEFQYINYCIFYLEIPDPGETTVVGQEYYCFIDRVDYAGVGVVGLSLKLDVWQFYQQYLQLQECFVERGHIDYYDANGELDKTYLDVAEDIDIGRDREYNYLSTPGITFDKASFASDFAFLVINYSDSKIPDLISGGVWGVPGGNFGGINPIKTLIIPMALQSSIPIYGEYWSNYENAYVRATKPFPLWYDLFRLGANPGILIGQNGIVSVYIERQLPGNWYMYDITTSPTDVKYCVRAPKPDNGNIYYILSLDNSLKYNMFAVGNTPISEGQISMLELNEDPILTEPFDPNLTSLTVDLPTTVEKKAYCYPYCYPMLTMDRGFEYIIKPQFLTKLNHTTSLPIPFGSLAIMYVYACADYRKSGYFVAGYKRKSNLTVTEDRTYIADYIDNIDAIPEVLDMTANNNQTDVPLITDQLVQYINEKKASERAGLVVSGVNAATSILGNAAGAAGGMTNPASAVSGNIGSALNFGFDLMKVAAHRRDLQDAPNTVRAPGNDYGFEFAAKSSGLSLFHCTLPTPRLKEVINYFERFGTAIKKVIKYNINSRERWNYVKTIGARFLIYAPNGYDYRYQMTDAHYRALQQIFDNGVRIWHYPVTDFMIGKFTDENGNTYWNGSV